MVQQWLALAEFFLYTAIGAMALGLWWLVNDRVLTPGVSIRAEIFGEKPNLAVAFDVLGGFLALGIVVHTTLELPPQVSLLQDVEAVVLSMVTMVLLLAILRLIAAGFIRFWFRNEKDEHGDTISINNELFAQHNTATGLFSAALYLLLAAGLARFNPLSASDLGLVSLADSAAVWVFGVGVIQVHSWTHLGIGPKHNILRECFYFNNPGASLSMLGLMLGMVWTFERLLDSLPIASAWTHWEPWAYTGLALLAVLLINGIVWLILKGFFGLNLRKELLANKNPAWGVLDGGLMFTLSMVAHALVY